MHLKIIREPKFYDDSGLTPSQHVVATYKPAEKLVTVDCEMDIVTLGIVCQVLKSQYDTYLKKLKPEIATHIKQTLNQVFEEEGMTDIEKHRNKAAK